MSYCEGLRQNEHVQYIAKDPGDASHTVLQASPILMLCAHLFQTESIIQIVEFWQFVVGSIVSIYLAKRWIKSKIFLTHVNIAKVYLWCNKVVRSILLLPLIKLKLPLLFLT